MTDTQTIEKPDTGTDIAIIDSTVTALTVFGTDGGVDAILDRITTQARAVETDISTPAGRRAVASLAYKIARSKTALDAMGKDLGEQNYRAWKAITSERSRIETALDALGAEIRRPLTDWENADKARIASHEAALIAIEELAHFDDEPPIAEIDRRIARLNDADLDRADWQEFAKRAENTRAGVARTLVSMRQRRIEAAAEAAAAAQRARDEAEVRAAEEASRQRLREALAAANARREAEERARVAAEAEAARVEREARETAERNAAELARVEREREEAQAAAVLAEAERIAAIEKAEADAHAAGVKADADRKAAAEQAATAERKRIADERAAEAAATAKREANKRHRQRINREALDDLVAATEITEAAARAVITAIVAGKVRHVGVTY